MAFAIVLMRDDFDIFNNRGFIHVILATTYQLKEDVLIPIRSEGEYSYGRCTYKREFRELSSECQVELSDQKTHHANSIVYTLERAIFP